MDPDCFQLTQQNYMKKCFGDGCCRHFYSLDGLNRHIEICRKLIHNQECFFCDISLNRFPSSVVLHVKSECQIQIKILSSLRTLKIWNGHRLLSLPSWKMFWNLFCSKYQEHFPALMLWWILSYSRVQQVWNTFKIQKLGQYMKTDILL